MSDFGPPPGPSGPPGPPGPAGPPPGSSATRAPSATADGGSGQQVAILTYAAAALGVLSFIWGFLDWFGDSSAGVHGYSPVGGPAGAVIGLALVAGLIAAAATFEKKPLGIAPAAIAVAGLLVAFGALVGHGDTGGATDTKIGLILAFITAIVQAAALVVAWMLSTGKLAALGGAGSSSQPANQWQQGPGQQGRGPQGPGPQGRGPQGQFGGFPSERGQFGPPPGYGPPPSQESAPSYGPPPGAPAGPPPGYGPPPSGSAPSYGPPPGAPAGPPPGYGRPPEPPAFSREPQQQPSATPPEPPSSEDEASRTQVLPRFQGDQISAQQGVPTFDPQARPDERPGERTGEEPPNYGR